MSESDNTLLIYTTFPALEEAKSVARQVVSEKLAACANIIPGMIAVYEWENSLEEGSETVVIFKTQKALQARITEKILSLHSYTVPAVISIDAGCENPDYLDWLVKQTAS